MVEAFHQIRAGSQPNLATASQSRLESDQHETQAMIENVLHINMLVAARAESQRAERRVARRNPDTDLHDDPGGYEDLCGICHEQFEHGECLVRLGCLAHVFHSDCWASAIRIFDRDLQAYQDDINTPWGRRLPVPREPRCPLCRGSSVIDRRFIHTADLHMHGTPSQSSQHGDFQSVAGSDTVRPYSLPPVPDDVEDVFPWWPVASDDGIQPDAPYLLASTSLPEGRQGILVDPGAYTNLIGSDAVRAMAQAALKAGLQPRQERLAKPLHVSGVGKGSQEATWEVILPIAVPHLETGIATLHEYRAPVVGGKGAHLPPLFGLRSTGSKQGVLETRLGHQQLSFPGPGGYEVTWSPGTVHFPLEPAPSGHLILPTDAFDRVRPTTAAANTSMSFTAATDTVGTTSGTSSSSSSTPLDTPSAPLAVQDTVPVAMDEADKGGRVPSSSGASSITFNP